MLTRHSLEFPLSVVSAASLASALPTLVDTTNNLEKNTVTPFSTSLVAIYRPYTNQLASRTASLVPRYPENCTSGLRCT